MSPDSGSTAAPTPPPAPTPSVHDGVHPALTTRFCRLVGVRYPIVQTGMGWVAGPRLVAATAEAGGLGILASATMTFAELAPPSPRSEPVRTSPSASTCGPTWPTWPTGSP